MPGAPTVVQNTNLGGLAGQSVALGTLCMGLTFEVGVDLMEVLVVHSLQK